MININYNPDVLSCLSNLSNDEVFTPPKLVNKMLDILPQELFQNKETTFLDPVTKSGVFLREIAKRLNEGLKDQIPSKQERINHIFTRQVYGIPITELTSLLARRSTYCSKYANGKYSVCTNFKNEQGNIKYSRIQHTWQNGKCIYCGASEDEYSRTNDLETYAYQFIHTDEPQKLFNMKFDVIIGNPPYQLSDGSGGSTDAAMPIYHKFIEQSKKLKPKFLSMIIPSKWMVGGRGLNKFRQEMYNDSSLSKIFDYENAAECFPGIHLDGGACYFLWEENYSGKVEYTYKSNDGSITKTKRVLSNDYFQFVIRDNRILKLIEKVSNNNMFSELVSPTKPFGIRKFLFNEPHRYADAELSEKPFINSIKIFGVKGLKGGAKRKVGYINKKIVVRNIDTIKKYKLFFTTSYSTNAVQPPEIIKGEPGDICTETFLLIGPFEDKRLQQNCYDYMNTNFFKALLFFGKGTMQVTSSVFSLIPMIDFSQSWDDVKLMKHFKLNDEEIKFINNLFKQ